ncbi:MAG: metal-dependent hydrolase [Haliscomenobacteraceae bacterium CHB4]|nr:Inner membrane protein YbcI [Saprospiraceae bacterium]MCE7923131.1 metal-dependent hydrolase [Haliscomenobacteraceae bacterium CHB4]
MASLFGHIAASTALGYAFFPKQTRPATLLLAGFCAFAPDLDVMGFHFGIPYGSEWGHRGWTHSIFFAMIFGGLLAWFGTGCFSRPDNPLSTDKSAVAKAAWLIMSTLSHPLLDMLTNGGRGCALWWPFSTERIFFPFRPIQVSPMSVGGFISEWGITVLASEAVWIGLPALCLVGIARFIRAVR